MSKDDEVKFKATWNGEETDLAKLLELDNGNPQWVPKSLLMQYPGGMFSVPKFFADQEGIKGL